ncbi:DNA/RNA non-specific endonuclease [Bacillus sp. RAR_GA_16]|uniref:DNA/RNA non-specific endonuclease n=1 Tax=Bacillus sp. RAR_GA_16 TaxID=2876774 RepID=UPI001CCDADE0|nr:DNA/RNA non-specific endonuclease [Bacillus sp. RAR_GA_16]MCA0174656.1 DNA/RNA non-specific endonuclease [Bacillus sp. RAR_GA_16]
MKRDLKINYGILDGIIEQLHKYKHALDTMESSLAKINEYVKPNQGESIDAWVFTIEESEDYIRAYHEQIQDLLTLFESYVSDTNAYITPLARQSMMQVDRNDIWVNLQQIERGISGNVGKASRVASRVPYNTFSFFDDPTESEIEKSRSNEGNLNQIRREINRSESVLQQKMDDLWGIYNTKVKPFENTDDDYYGKAQKLKMSYTGVFEGVWDGVEDLSSDIYGFGKGLVLGLYEIGKGLVTVAGDAGIVYTSHHLPDSVEPDFLKEAADKRVEGYKAAAMQAIKDPMGVAEAITQSFSDTYEDEGVAYVAGNVSTAFIPYVGMAGKSASLAKVAGKIPNSNLSKVAGSSKVDVAAIVKKHNAFEGIKRGMGEFVQDVKGGMQIVGNSNRVAFGANGVAGNAVGKVDDVAESGVASVSRSSGPNRAVDDSIVRIKTEVERVDGGNRTGNRLAGESEVTPLVGKGEQYTNGRKNRLKPNIRYQTGEYDYFYETDGAGRITKFETDNLQLTTRVNRLSHSRNTLGKIKGKDHAGHLAGDRFGGSPKLDNLVSQLSDVNLKQYKKIEDEWAVALNDIPPKKVTVDVEISYEEIDLRPKTFIVNYTIDGKSGFKIIEN